MFQKYVRRRGKLSEVAATINPTNGFITMTVGATAEHDLKASKGVVLYYDADTNRIGMERTNDEKAEGFLKFHSVANNNFVKVIAKGFLEEFEILQGKDDTGLQCPIAVEDNMLIVDLNNGKPVQSNKRRKKQAEQASSEQEQSGSPTVQDYVKTAVEA